MVGTAPHELPPLDGGWTLERIELGTHEVRLWVPAAPEHLLDDEEVAARQAADDSMPYWAWLWDSAPALARQVVDAAWPAGTRVLEVGSGLGLVGIAAALAHLGRAEVTLSDADPLALAAAPVNARANGLFQVRTWRLDWRRPEDAPRERFDRVLGCDVIYEPAAHGPLLDVLERYLARDGEARVADPGRAHVEAFAEAAGTRGWTVAFLDAEGQPCMGPERGALRVLVLRRDEGRP